MAKKQRNFYRYEFRETKSKASYFAVETLYTQTTTQPCWGGGGQNEATTTTRASGKHFTKHFDIIYEANYTVVVVVVCRVQKRPAALFSLLPISSVPCAQFRGAAKNCNFRGKKRARAAAEQQKGCCMPCVLGGQQKTPKQVYLPPQLYRARNLNTKIKIYSFLVLARGMTSLPARLLLV